MAAPHRWDPTCPPPRGLVQPVPVDPTGRAGPTKAQAAGPRWRRSSPGLYVPAHVDAARPEQRILEQSVRLGESTGDGPPGAVTGWASCRMHGATFFDGRGRDGLSPRPVPLAIGQVDKRRAASGCTFSREPLDAAEIVLRADVLVTAADRALFDEMRSSRNWREAVVAVDMMAAARLTTIARMRDYHAARSRWRRASVVPIALDHASERSRSPGEVRMRLIWEVDAGLPPVLVNQEIFTLDGRLVGIADILDPVAGVVGEYDGAEHLRLGRRTRDVKREEAMRRLGLEYFTVLAPDVYEPAATAERMRDTRARARFLPPAGRRWTIVPPPWWRPFR